ncbi:hypothetical protein QTG54_010253 [Skeletonema marinoi]|uniref:Glycosyltransferase 2-like domain-containing protein n=1 Tax=Skeletonema marinoi TaxID=267567 RepID=A0AAD8Y4K4_9STRA|nr:hypothetical protein QTG54_010253 [Skeletonema marinoi]
MKEGDFLVYLDAGSQVNKGGEERFREYLKIVNESEYDMLCFEYRKTFNHEYKWTTENVFNAFNVSMEDPIRRTGQIEGGTLLMQKGPHLRSWLKIIQDALLQDPWIITDKYNHETELLTPDFRDNRHDQSISSVSRKIHGCEMLNAYVETCNRLHSLQDAIDSALKQTYPVSEVIVSIDSGPNCVKSIKNIWGNKDDRNPCGAGPIRNYAIEKASPYATHFAMLDDDDVWYPQKTEIQVKAMHEGNYSYASSDANKPRNGRCHGSKYISHDLEKGAFFLANGGRFKKLIWKKLNIPPDAKLPSHITEEVLSAHISSLILPQSSLKTFSMQHQDLIHREVKITTCG